MDAADCKPQLLNPSCKNCVYLANFVLKNKVYKRHCRSVSYSMMSLCKFHHITLKRQRIIIPLDWQFVVYPGGAGVDEGDVFYTSSLFCRDAGIEEGSGQCRMQKRVAVSFIYTIQSRAAGVEKGRCRRGRCRRGRPLLHRPFSTPYKVGHPVQKNSSTLATSVDEVGQPVAARRGRFQLAEPPVQRYDYTLPFKTS